MRSCGIYDARARLGELVRLAAAGEPTVIKVHGRPAAKLVAVTDGTEGSAAAVKRFVSRVKRRRPMTDADIRALIGEGRRH